MKTSQNTNQQLITVPNSNTIKGIENHKNTAAHLKAAAKNHLEAARHHEAGNHLQAAQSTIIAQGHVQLASDAQREDVKQHAQNG